MGTQYLGAFPSLDNKIAIDSICYQIGDFLLKKFPVDYFKHVFIDTQTGIANQYIVDKGEMVQVQSAQKIERPRLIIETKMSGNNVEDTPQAMLRNVYQQPGAYGIEAEMRGYQLFYADPFGTEMRTNDIYKKIDVTITMEVNGKSDQEALINILDTNIKKLYGYPLYVDSNYVLPINMVTYLRNCIFKKEIDYIKEYKDILTDNEIKDIHRKINSSFADLLVKYGYGDIQIVKTGDENNDDNSFAIILNRKQRVYLKIENFEPDEGTKRNNVYEYFKLTASGTFMFHNLVTFITKVPTIIRGKRSDNHMKTDSEKNMLNMYGIMDFREVYHEERELYKFYDNNWYSLFLLKECMMESQTETFTLLDQMNSKYLKDIKLLQILSLCTEDTFRRFFKIVINKGRELLTENVDYTYDKSLTITVNNCDVETPYYVELFANITWLNNMKNSIS